MINCLIRVHRPLGSGILQEARTKIKCRFTGGTGPVSAPGANEDLVDHGDRAVAPYPEQDDLARGDGKAGERPDVHIVGDHNDGLSRRETEQELPQVGGLPVGAGRVVG